MLAYVFWHWPASEVDRKSYEAGLVSFHKSLAAESPAGFQQSAVFRVDAAPWVEGKTGGYEDWYLLEASFALDPLNEGAVTGACKEFHDRVARAAAGGTAGLYRLRSAETNLTEMRFAAWLGKPRGTSYEEFDQQMRSWTDRPGFSLWQRQMVLGPTPEFCLRAPGRIDLPAGLAAATLALDLVWPRGK